MNFVDFALARLAAAETRAAVFDQDALEQIVAAGYAADGATLTGPYDGLFDELQIGVSVPRRATVDGYWGPMTAAERTEVRLALDGLGRHSTVRVDALWRGSVVARTSPANARISSVVSTWPDADGIDAEIVAALGSLPADAAALERERRRRLLGRLRAAFDQPAAFTDLWFDDWLQQIGAQSAGDVMARFRGQLLTGALQIAFTNPAAVPPSPRALPLSAAILIRDAAVDRRPPRRQQDDPRAPPRSRCRARARPGDEPARAPRDRVAGAERRVRRRRLAGRRCSGPPSSGVGVAGRGRHRRRRIVEESRAGDGTRRRLGPANERNSSWQLA
jgi:hypothetical protein